MSIGAWAYRPKRTESSAIAIAATNKHKVNNMKGLERCMMATSYFLENLAMTHSKKTGEPIRGFIVPESMRKELTNDDECQFFGDHEILIGADCWELYTSNFPAVMIINDNGTVERVQ
jgi:hypothetical protein